MTSTVWNVSDVSSHIALSNTDHTATSGSGSGNEGVRATVSHSTGKWYIEFSNISLLYGGIIGFAAAGDALGSSGQAGVTAGSPGYLQVGGSDYGPYGNANGTVLSFAVDFTNNQIWTRTNGGNWNGSGTADPATNTGGQSISSLTTPLFPYAWLQFNPDTVDINGGDSTFSYTAPTGFNPWNGIAGVTGTWASTEAADAMAFIGYPGTFGLIGQLAATEAPDVLAALGYILTTGTLVGSEYQDRFSAYGYLPVYGPWTSTEAPDIFAAAGVGLGRNGTWASTEAPDIFAALGVGPVLGPLAATDPQDRFQAIGAGVTQVRPRRKLFVT